MAFSPAAVVASFHGLPRVDFFYGHYSQSAPNAFDTATHSIYWGGVLSTAAVVAIAGFLLFCVLSLIDLAASCWWARPTRRRQLSQVRGYFNHPQST